MLAEREMIKAREKMITVRGRVNRLNEKDVKSLIEDAIERYPGFDPSMLKEPRINMLDYLFDLDDSILMPLLATLSK